MRVAWELPTSNSFDETLGRTGLRRINLRFPSRPEIRYCKAEISIDQLAVWQRNRDALCQDLSRIDPELRNEIETIIRVWPQVDAKVRAVILTIIGED